MVLDYIKRKTYEITLGIIALTLTSCAPNMQIVCGKDLKNNLDSTITELAVNSIRDYGPEILECAEELRAKDKDNAARILYTHPNNISILPGCHLTSGKVSRNIIFSYLLSEGYLRLSKNERGRCKINIINSCIPNRLPDLESHIEDLDLDGNQVITHFEVKTYLDSINKCASSILRH